MALIISFQNFTELEPLSDYKVDVWINDRHIDGPFLVKHHKRDDGWKSLVNMFAKHFCNPTSQPIKKLPLENEFPHIVTDQKHILRNIIRCKLCNTKLESRHRHDFQSCKCGTFVDGGLDYVRTGWQGGQSNENCIEYLTEYRKD